MIAKASNKIAIYFANNNIFKQEEVSVYSYGFELLLSTILNGLGILMISIFMKDILASILFTLAFIPLRLAGGGYHAKHHWSCILSINVAFLFFIVLLNNVSESFTSYYVLFVSMISSLIVWILAPVEAANKPVSESKQKNMRKRSIFIAIINMLVALSFFTIPILPVKIAAYYLSGAFASSVSMVVASITSKASK